MGGSELLFYIAKLGPGGNEIDTTLLGEHSQVKQGTRVDITITSFKTNVAGHGW